MNPDTQHERIFLSTRADTFLYIKLMICDRRYS